QVSGRRVDGIYVAEVDFLAARDGSRLPCLASIGSTDKCPICAAGPDYVCIDDAQAVQTCGSVRLLRAPLPGRGRTGWRREKQPSHDYNGQKVHAAQATLRLPTSR